MSESEEFDLLPSQWAKMAAHINASGLRPADFDRTSIEVPAWAMSSKVPAIVHVPTGYFFAIEDDWLATLNGEKNVGFRIGFAPGEQMGFQAVSGVSWIEAAGHFRKWLTYTRREAEARDFVAILGHLADAAPSSGEDDETRFSEAEQQEIVARLDALETMVRDLRFDGGMLFRDLGELREDVSRMKRGRFKKLLLGTVAKWAVTKALTADQVRQVLESLQDIVLGSGQDLLKP